MMDLSTYVAMLGKRVEAQVRWDWDLSPGLHSLDFASKVNTSLGIGYRKGMQKLEEASQTPDDSRIGLAMKKLYDLLQTGEYLDDHNARRPIKGDVTKLHKVIGLTPLHQHVLRNVFFMSSKTGRCTANPQNDWTCSDRRSGSFRHSCFL